MYFNRIRSYIIFFVFLFLLTISYHNTISEEVLLFDDFNGPNLNTSTWGIGTWNIGSKSQFGNTPEFKSNNGTTYASLIMDTYNPNSPGTRVLGTEIWSLENFDASGGIEFEARVRALDITGGQICSFFTYQGNQSGPDWISDEIDIEIVTTKPTDTVLFTSWNDWVDGSNDYGDGIHHLSTYVSIAGYNYQDWNIYKIRWYSDRVEWYVNGVLKNTHTSPVPDRAMPIRANFWAAGPSWAEAHDASLQPTSDAASNQRYYYDIDYIKVTSLGESVEAPTNLSANVNETSVNLSWDDNSLNEDGFEIFRAKKPKGRRSPEYSSIGTTGTDINSFTDSPGNGSWLYKVNAFNSNSVSADSNEIQVSVGSKKKGGGKKNRN